MRKDTIYREDAIKATWQEPTYTDPLNVLTEVRDRIEAIPSADRPQEWIPCSERLPEEDGFYLVTVTDGEQIAVCKMPFVEAEWRDNWFDDEVIAWMTLPKPYKEGANDDIRSNR